MFFELEPLKRDKYGKDIFGGFPPYKTGDFYARIGEAMMTAVATRIKFLADEFGYERNNLLELQHRVIEINRRIGRIPKD